MRCRLAVALLGWVLWQQIVTDPNPSGAKPVWTSLEFPDDEAGCATVLRTEVAQAHTRVDGGQFMGKRADKTPDGFIDITDDPPERITTRYLCRPDSFQP